MKQNLSTTLNTSKSTLILSLLLSILLCYPNSILTSDNTSSQEYSQSYSNSCSNSNFNDYPVTPKKNKITELSRTKLSTANKDTLYLGSIKLPKQLAKLGGVMHENVDCTITEAFTYLCCHFISV